MRPPTFDLVVTFAAALCVGSALAAVAVNHVLNRPGADVRRRIRSPVATLSMLGFMAAMTAVVWLRLGVLPLAELPRRGMLLLGLTIMLIGAALNVVGRLNLGRNWADQVTEYADQSLVQHGAYAVVRHPLYTSIVWMFVGASLISRNMVLLGCTFFVFIPAMVFRARQEEQLLEKRFPEYDDYRRRVGMLFPRRHTRPRRP
jgi:protein-S-isoprenylcysteine O-methyltransferase Ste14